MTTRNELLIKGGAAAGGLAATYTGGVFLIGVVRQIASGASYELTLTTDDLQIVMDSPIVNSNSGDLTFEAFEGTVFTGGTPVAAFNNDRNSTLAAGLTGVVIDATISDIGVQMMPTVNTVGDNNAGASRTFSLGYPLILKPNTSYTMRITHNDGQNRQVNFYAAAYRRRDLI